MSGGSRLAPGRLSSGWSVRFMHNAAVGWSLLLRQPPAHGHRAAWPPRSRLAWWAAGSLLAFVVAMVLVDAWTIGHVRQLPAPLVAIFGYVTDLGLSGWFLVPLGTALLLIAAVSAPDAPRYVRDTWTALSIRIGFLFLAVAVPGLTVSIVKRLIGRARPFVEGHDTFAYQLFVWRPDYASLPSGHTTTAFAVAVAVGAMWPRARAVVFTLAALIGISRVVVGAHHPSDIVAGAVFGAMGALLVRNWYVDRRLGFVAAPDGSVRALRWPSWQRLRRVARRMRWQERTA